MLYIEKTINVYQEIVFLYIIKSNKILEIKKRLDLIVII